VRGLKLDSKSHHNNGYLVAPFTGAWIEMALFGIICTTGDRSELLNESCIEMMMRTDVNKQIIKNEFLLVFYNLKLVFKSTDFHLTTT